MFGWTIVRRHDDIDLKIDTYQYLASEDGQIPTCSPTALSETGFEYGACIIHIAYELGRLSARWGRVGYRFLNNLLFDPVLPYAIRDHREAHPQDRYMYGSRGRLGQAPVEYANEYVADLGTDGSLTVRYWVFPERKRGEEEDDGELGVNIDSYLEAPGSARTVIVTLNGQRHAYLEKAYVKNATRYSLLSDTLLVQVETDQLARQRKKGLFPATRSGILAGEDKLELIERSVREALVGDKELNRLEQKRIQRRLATVDEESEARVRRLLDQLISISRPFVGPGADSKGGNGQVAGGPIAFKSKDPPTYFRFAEEKQPLRIQPGDRRVVDVVTNGPNDMLTRKQRKGRMTLETLGNPDIALRGGLLHNGRMAITVTASGDGKVGAGGDLRAVLEIDGGIYFASQRPVQVVPPPPPYSGQEPLTKFTIVARGNVVRLRRGKVTQVTIETDCRDDLLSRPSGSAHFEVHTTIPGVLLTARRGPHRGEIEAFMQTPNGVQPNPEETQSTITARLALPDGSVIEDTKQCVVVEPPPPQQTDGKKKRPRSNYSIIEVWRDPPAEQPTARTWDDENWDQTDVGKYALTQDSEGYDLLLLYVNMDNEDLTKERGRRLASSGEGATRRLDIRYQAYVGHHLWLHNQRSSKSALQPIAQAGQSGPLNQETALDEDFLESPQDEAALKEEMQRVTKTVLLTMRSETDLFAAVDREVP